MSTAMATSTSLHPRVRRLCRSINTQQVWRARGRGRGRAARGIRLCSAPSHSQRPTDLSDAISIARAPPAARRLHCTRLGCLLRLFPVAACRVVCRQPRRRPARPAAGHVRRCASNPPAVTNYLSAFRHTAPPPPPSRCERWTPQPAP